MLHEFKIVYPYVQADMVVETLAQHGIYNVSYEPVIQVIQIPNGYDYIVQEEHEVPIAIYFEDDDSSNGEKEYLRRLAAILQIPEKQISYKYVKEEDWNSTFPDINLANGWTIRMKESNYLYDPNKTILFDPQGAFGTGLHETTRDCLEFILERDFSTERVLDLGTGSGILSIAAGIKHSPYIEAFDIEDVQRQVLYNASLNQVNSIKVYHSNVIEDQIPREYDWVFINIGCEETISLLRKQPFLSTCDNFLISGLVEWNEQRVVEALREAGFEQRKRKQTNEWVTIYYTRGK